MQGYVDYYIEKIENFFKEKETFAEIILIGGLAMEYYGSPKYTLDIDGEIHCDEKEYYEFLDYLVKEKINFNLGEDISGWGIIPLPEGYRERAITVHESEFLKLKILEPVDFVYSKLLRGTEEDFEDIVKVIKKFKLTKQDILNKEHLVKYPKDPETLFFKKKLQYLIGLIDSISLNT